MAKGDEITGNSMGGGLASPTATRGQSGIMKGLNLGASLLPSSMDLYGGGGGRAPISPTMDMGQLLDLAGLFRRQGQSPGPATPPFNPQGGMPPVDSTWRTWGRFGGR